MARTKITGNPKKVDSPPASKSLGTARTSTRLSASQKGKSKMAVLSSSSSSTSDGDWSSLDKEAIAAKHKRTKSKVFRHKDLLKQLAERMEEERRAAEKLTELSKDSKGTSSSSRHPMVSKSSYEELHKTSFVASDHDTSPTASKSTHAPVSPVRASVPTPADGVETPSSAIPDVTHSVPPPPPPQIVTESSIPRRKKALARKYAGRPSVKSPPSKRLASDSHYFSLSFWSKEAAEREINVSKRAFLSERPIHLASYTEKSDIIPLLEASHLLHSVTAYSGYVESIVKEFYCNLEKSVQDFSSSVFGRVYIRGQMVDFNEFCISEYLHLQWADEDEAEVDWDSVVQKLTGGLRSLWPKRKDFPSAELTLSYSLLHKIALCNWMPSTHSTGVKKPLALLLFNIGTNKSFNLGRIIFEHICLAATSKVSSSHLIFPNLIFGVLVEQCPALKGDAAVMVHPLPMKLTAKSLKKRLSIPVSEETVTGVATPSDPSSSTPLSKKSKSATIARLRTVEAQAKSIRALLDHHLTLIGATLGDLLADDQDSSHSDECSSDDA